MVVSFEVSDDVGYAMKLGAMSSWIVRAANYWAGVCIIHDDVLVSLFRMGSIIQSMTVIIGYGRSCQLLIVPPDSLLSSITFIFDALELDG